MTNYENRSHTNVFSLQISEITNSKEAEKGMNCGLMIRHSYLEVSVLTTPVCVSTTTQGSWVTLLKQKKRCHFY